MTSLIIRIAIFILVMILVQWFMKQLRGSRKSSPGSKPPRGENMVKDPMCGMYMDPRLAVKHKTNTGVFYFCSEDCKNKFLKINPGKSPDEPSPGT